VLGLGLSLVLNAWFGNFEVMECEVERDGPGGRLFRFGVRGRGTGCIASDGDVLISREPGGVQRSACKEAVGDWGLREAEGREEGSIRVSLGVSWLTTPQIAFSISNTVALPSFFAVERYSCAFTKEGMYKGHVRCTRCNMPSRVSVALVCVRWEKRKCGGSIFALSEPQEADGAVEGVSSGH